MLLARIYEAFPLTCPFCRAPMRIIAFINDADSVSRILSHIGESTLPPKIAPARGPPLWESVGAGRRKTILNGIRQPSLNRSSTECA